MSDTLDALSDLVKHPGWALFVAHCREEWSPTGTRYHSEMAKALDETDSRLAHLKALQVVAVHRMVENLLGWPGQEVSRLMRAEEPLSVGGPQRGGYR